MEDQEAVIEKEIIRQTNLLKRIRQSQSMLKDAMDSVGKFRIEERPGIYLSLIHIWKADERQPDHQ